MELTTKKKDTDAEMKNDYWSFEIVKADYSEIEIKLTFEDKVIPLGEMQKLENAIRKVLEACGRLDTFQPSKRQ